MTLVKSDARVFLYLAGLVLYFSPLLLLLLFCFKLAQIQCASTSLLSRGKNTKFNKSVLSFY